MQVESFLEASARQWPEKTALVCGSQRWTYAQLEATANRLAHGLVAEGVERGDRVAIQFDNGIEAAVSIFAVLKAGAVLLMVNPTTKAEKLRAILDHSRAAVLLTSARKAAAAGDALAGASHLRTVIVTDPPDTGLPLPGKTCLGWKTLLDRHQDGVLPPPRRAIDIDLAALLYTSGSTGTPKGVMLTHRNMVSAATSITTYLENTHDEIILSTLPLSFGYGLYQLLMGAKIGGTVVLERSFTYPQSVLKKLIDERATAFPLVPTMAAILLQMDLTKVDWSNLRYITSAAAALPTEHITRLRTLLPRVRIYSMYGQTECTRVSYLPPDQIDRRPESVGRGMPNEEVYLVDEEGRRLGPGATGELVVRGANVMKGYWELPEETARRLRPGLLPGENVLHTGDLFRMDEEGYLTFIARKDDIIKSRGEKVSPCEVENVLCGHPEIAEAVVIGVPDAILGQAVRAIVSLKSGSQLTEQEILRHCAQRLEDYMVPKTVEVRATLPKTNNGKIDKRQLMSSAQPVNRSAESGAANPAGTAVVAVEMESWTDSESATSGVAT